MQKQKIHDKFLEKGSITGSDGTKTVRARPQPRYQVSRPRQQPSGYKT